MKDRTLRRQVLTAGLGVPDLVAYLVEDPPDYDAVGVDERARVELGEDERRKAERADELGVDITISMTHLATIAGAVALAKPRRD